MRLRELQLAAAKKEADEEAREEELDRRRDRGLRYPSGIHRRLGARSAK
jgi:hypothetical protein